MTGAAGILGDLPVPGDVSTKPPCSTCGWLQAIGSMRLGFAQELRRLLQIADKHHMTTVHAHVGRQLDVVRPKRQEPCVLRPKVDPSCGLNVSRLEIHRTAAWAFSFGLHRRLNRVAGGAPQALIFGTPSFSLPRPKPAPRDLSALGSRPLPAGDRPHTAFQRGHAPSVSRTRP